MIVKVPKRYWNFNSLMEFLEIGYKTMGLELQPIIEWLYDKPAKRLKGRVYKTFTMHLKKAIESRKPYEEILALLESFDIYTIQTKGDASEVADILCRWEGDREFFVFYDIDRNIIKIIELEGVLV